MDTTKLEFLRGTLDVLILKALIWGPLHGYAVTELIRRQSEDALLVEEGTLYPALWRLENKGLLEAEWGFSENNRKAKYYRLTAARPASTASRSEDVGGVRCGSDQGAQCDAAPLPEEADETVPLWRRYARFFGPDPAADAKDELRFHMEDRRSTNRSRGGPGKPLDRKRSGGWATCMCWNESGRE